ncbi:hypothetical protein ACODT5_07435 [Streptomyces sp. 5.8]|uniref:hypothetical protein n=1 Tax=Streptomyces sp. 5.8 TaxID=3406571 RepID=UPI003BB74F08
MPKTPPFPCPAGRIPNGTRTPAFNGSYTEAKLNQAVFVCIYREGITQLEQRNIELTRALEERQAELDATRAANRDLTRALNQRG